MLYELGQIADRTTFRVNPQDAKEQLEQGARESSEAVGLARRRLATIVIPEAARRKALYELQLAREKFEMVTTEARRAPEQKLVMEPHTYTGYSAASRDAIVACRGLGQNPASN